VNDSLLTKSLRVAPILGDAGFDRQLDIYRLARMGDKRSAGLWNEFARLDKAGARMVAENAKTVDAERKAARKQAGMVIKSAKKPKVTKVAKSLAVTKAYTGRLAKAERKLAGNPVLASLLKSDNPEEREFARMHLGI